MEKTTRESEVARLRQLGLEVPNWDGLGAYWRKFDESAEKLGLLVHLSSDERMELFIEVCRRLQAEGQKA